MDKREGSKQIPFLRWTWNTDVKQICKEQGTVNMAITCRDAVILIHKCVLIAKSLYFRKQLGKNSKINQIIVDLDVAVMKSLIEFIYCSRTTFRDKDLAYIIAAARLFQLNEAIFRNKAKINVRAQADAMQIPSPIFVYIHPTVCNPNTVYYLLPFTTSNNPVSDESHLYYKLQQKCFTEAKEKVCSRENLEEALDKEIDDTIMQNFLPNSDEVPLPFMEYEELFNLLNPHEHVSSMNETEQCAELLNFDVKDTNKQIKPENFLPYSDEVPLQFLEFEDLCHSSPPKHVVCLKETEQCTGLLHFDDKDTNGQVIPENIEYETTAGSLPIRQTDGLELIMEAPKEGWILQNTDCLNTSNDDNN